MCPLSFNLKLLYLAVVEQVNVLAEEVLAVGVLIHHVHLGAELGIGGKLSQVAMAGDNVLRPQH